MRRCKYHQGKYKPLNPDKYIGDVNNIIYRSGLEKRYMNFFDTNSNVLEWISEEIVIPYIKPNDGKKHRYFPDFWIKIKENTGEIKEYLIEIKPSNEVTPPKKKGKYFDSKMKTYLINIAKWNATKKVCEQKNWEFKIFTEKNL